MSAVPEGPGPAHAPAAPPEQSRGIFTPELLERCISCGFCLPACPTYALTGIESSSPRGRIELMRAIETGALPEDDPTAEEETSFCLGCRACEPVCPAGVQYAELLEEWRAFAWRERHALALRQRLTLAVLLWAVDRRWRVRLLGALRNHARRQRGEGPHLMLGCFERALYPAVSRAAARLVPGLQINPRQGCCGALHAHNGDPERGRALAEELGQRLPGTIVTTSGGCAAHLSSVLGPGRVREISQWLHNEDAGGEDGAGEGQAHGAEEGRAHGAGEDRAGARALRVALQDSCHLRNGLGVALEPRELLRGFDYVELPSAARCCGAAGTYSLLRPSDSARVLSAKLDEIEAAGVDIVVAVNPGCLRQLQTGLRARRSTVRALHIVELLAQRP